MLAAPHAIPSALPMIWVPVVLFAALAQTVRNAAQRSLTAELGTLPATLARFLFGLPFAAVYLLLALAHMDWLREAPGLVWLAALGALAYLALAVRYWFRTPLIGIALASVCFLAAAIVLSV